MKRIILRKNELIARDREDLQVAVHMQRVARYGLKNWDKDTAVTKDARARVLGGCLVSLIGALGGTENKSVKGLPRLEKLVTIGS